VAFARTLLLAALLGSACATTDGRLRLRGMEVEGNDGVADREILERLALDAEEGYAWDDERYLDPLLFDRDVPRVARIYRALGYYHATLDAVSLRWAAEGDGVVLTFHVTEGAPTILERLTVTGLDDLPPSVQAELRAALRVEEGQRLTEDDWDATKEGLRQALRDGGYPTPLVDGTVRVDPATDTATAELRLEPGAPARFGEVLIDGLTELPEPAIRSEIGIEPGTGYSAEAVDEARDALIAAGLFSGIEVVELPHPPGAAGAAGDFGLVDLDVHLDEGNMQRLKLGVGLATEQERQQAEVTARWEHRNLFGGLRRIVWANRFGWAFNFGDLEHIDLGPFGGTSLTFRQPHADDLRLAFISSLKYEAEPVSPEYSTHAIQARLGAERTFRDRSFSLGLHNGVRWVDLWNVTNPDAVAEVPYLLYLLDATLTLDLRDDPLQTREGHYVSLLLRLGVDPQGGDYDDDPARDFYRYLLVKQDLRGYYRLHERLTLVLRVATGLIFPFDDESLAPPDERLFSGGANSIRGYPYRRIGTWFSCPDDDPACVERVPAGQSVPPAGGNTLWEFSVELRVQIWGGFSAAAFFDAGNVLDGAFRTVYPESILQFHPSVGAGLRYQTAVGPVRLDIAVPLQDDPRLADVGPVSFHLTIGEAF
jgi:translocation and assembly module TamA